MREGFTNGSRPEHVDADSAFDALAALLQAGFLYPPNDPRVAEACTTLRQRVHEVASDGTPVEVRVCAEGVDLGGARFGHTKPGATWVRDRLARAGLAAVQIAPVASPRALIAFVVVLRRCYPPNAPAFAELWRGSGHGVEPIPAGAAGPATAAAAQPATAGRHDPILVALSRSKKARPILGDIHRRVEEEYEGQVQVDIAGMLEEVIDQLPDALRRDPRRGYAQVEAVLDLLHRQLEGFLLAHPDDPGQRLTDVAKTLLKRRLKAAGDAATSRPTPSGTKSPQPLPPTAAAPVPTPSPAPAPAPAPARPSVPSAPARPPQPSPATKPAPISADSFQGFMAGLQDDLANPSAGARLNRLEEGATQDPVTDDVPALLEELAALPKPDVLDPELDEPATTDELLGACLHLLAYGRHDTAVRDGTVRLVDHLMATPTPRQRRILGAYLRLAREGNLLERNPGAQERLVEFLQSNGVQHLMSTRETLDVEQVAQTFPTQFAMFLDALELKDPTSGPAFLELWDLVGDDGMLRSTASLIEDGTLLTPNRTEKILKFGGPRAAPIAQQLVRGGANWTRSQIVNYLRRQDLPRQESAALSIVQPVTSLPPAYLADLCGVIAADGAPNSKLHGYTSLLLRQYIRDTAENTKDLERRLYAIRALGHWPTPETEQYLEQLAKEGRLLQQSKEARAVRQAASEALTQIQGQRTEGP